MRGIRLLFALAILCTTAAWGQEPMTAVMDTQPSSSQPCEEGPRIVRLMLSPAPQPQPALKYRLLPPLWEQTPGDGMALYYTASDVIEGLAKTEDLGDKISNWPDLPMEKMPWKEVRNLLDSQSTVIELLDLAARHNQCQWNLPVGKQGISMLLPSLSTWRFGAKIINARVRLAVHEGRFDDAIYSMRTSLGMSQDVAEGPTVINALVGTAIARMTLTSAEDFIGAPDSPNVYWALTSLPRPFVDLTLGMQGETEMAFGTFPQLRENEAAKLSPKEWDELLRKATAVLGKDTGIIGGLDMDTAIAATMQSYQHGKHYFRSQGYTEEHVNAMPVGKVVLLYSLNTYAVLRDDIFKWWSVPFWRAWPELQKVETKIQQARQAGQGAPFIVLLPSMGKAYMLTTNTDARIAALRCIEAIRMYAAAHQRRLPNSLEEIQEVPVPLNPITGKPLKYRLEGETATLDIPAPQGESATHGTRYFLTIRK